MKTRIILITGASSGIGRTTALYLAKKGYHVIACVRKPRDAQELLQEADNAGKARGKLETQLVDVNVAADVDRLAAYVGELFANDENISFFGLINNAGVSPVAPIEMVSMEEMEYIFRTNVFSVVRLIQAMLPYLKYTTGRIINISSGSGVMAIPLSGAYSMSKFSIEALSDVLRVELKQFGIKTVVVEPGLIRTPIHEKNCNSMDHLLAGFDAQQRDDYENALRTYVETQGKAARTATQPIAVSKVIRKALEVNNPRTRYGAGKDARALRAIHWLLNDRVRDKITANLCGW
jgi:NAD(P)-dependent dehydrogenase (short-subunit alcohol dehydrogenase family)